MNPGQKKRIISWKTIPRPTATPSLLLLCKFEGGWIDTGVRGTQESASSHSLSRDMLVLDTLDSVRLVLHWVTQWRAEGFSAGSSCLQVSVNGHTHATRQCFCCLWVSQRRFSQHIFDNLVWRDRFYTDIYIYNRNRTDGHHRYDWIRESFGSWFIIPARQFRGKMQHII